MANAVNAGKQQHISTIDLDRCSLHADVIINAADTGANQLLSQQRLIICAVGVVGSCGVAWKLQRNGCWRSLLQKTHQPMLSPYLLGQAWTCKQAGQHNKG